MQWKSVNMGHVLLTAIMLSFPVAGQNARVDVAKHLTPIPKACESVTPAAIEGTVDIAALVKEALCKGAGDMLSDYTFVVESVKREKDKKEKVKEERITYEVFIPTLKSGMRTKGVLIVTSRNQIPVPPDELEKERMKAAERIEKEEKKIESATPATPEARSTPVTGMMPLGSYAQTGINRSALGVRRAGATLAVRTFLKNCDLTLARREKIDGRETLIFNFTPRPDAAFTENEKYVAQLKGEIWIDAQDRIVTRLMGWPASTPAEQSPAVYFEMMKLPAHGIWLPHVARINGADYPKLFDGIKTDSTSTYSNHIRFSSEVKDAKVGPPTQP